MKKVLVPVNFSEIGREAWRYAVEFAAHYKGKVVVMHAFEEPPLEAHTPGDMLPEILAEEREQTIAKLRQLTEQTIGRVDVQLDLVAVPGPVTEAVRSYRDSNEVDLLIVGAHHASGVEEWLTGTIASSLITHTELPVLVIPEGVNFKAVEHIALAVEREQDVLAEMNEIQELINPFAAKLTLVHVVVDKDDPEADDLEQQLKEDFSHFPNVEVVVISEADVEDALSDFAKTHQVDVLAMIYKDNTFWDSLFNRSITKKLTYHAQVPVLSLPLINPSGKS